MSNSVHLQDFPIFSKNLINQELSDNMSIVQTIISAWLSRRAKNKIRVRQPLNSIIIWFNLAEEFKEIVQEELNIKNIIIDESINEKVQKIVKPNGKILWKKLWKDFKTVLNLAKSWQFEEIEDWKVKVSDFILEPTEFEIDYIKTDETLDIEVNNWIVISIDWTITKELENEWFVRDLIRSIQEARKEADYNLEDRISLDIEDKDWFTKDFIDYIQAETLSTIVKINNPDLTKEIELWEHKIVFKLKK